MYGQVAVLVSVVPYRVSLRGWEDAAGQQFDTPPLKDDFRYGRVWGIHVHVWDPDEPADQHDWWTYTPYRIRSWDDWFDLIDSVAGQHGYELA